MKNNGLSGHIFVIGGPTGTGKTDLAISISDLLTKNSRKPSIVNFDSLCFYKEISIGTAKPSEEQLKMFPHYFIDNATIKNEVNAYDFQLEAKNLIEKKLAQNEDIVLVGGSAFYLRALLKGMYLETKNDTDDEYLAKSHDEILKKEGITPFLEYLKNFDQESFKLLHPNDHYRILRAVEFHKKNGYPLTQQKKIFENHNPYDLSQNQFPQASFVNFFLDIERPLHWELLKKRTTKMLQSGLIEEVQFLLSNGFSGLEKPLQSIGYYETLQYLRGTIKSKEDLIEAIYISTRQLAKAQRTFFKKFSPHFKLNPLEQTPFIIDKVLSTLN